MKALPAIGLLAVLTPFAAGAECTEVPDIAQLPDGNTASREEMLAANKTIHDYNTAVDGYVECLRKSGGNRSREDRAIDKLEKIASSYNAAVRAFKKRGGG
jgi:hypothetical protein